MRSAALLAPVLALLVSGCGGGAQFEVPLQVFESEDGRALAFVPVFIDETGPFDFLLDTGAARSAIDDDLAAELALADEGVEVVQGIGGEVETRLVRVGDWRLGFDVELAPRVLNAVDLPSSDGERAFHGILGSDVLGDFALVQLDYQEEVMFLEVDSGDPGEVLR